jgi:hypothetical protein
MFEMATPLVSATALSVDDKSSRARQQLMEQRFDQAPVTRAGRLAGWVRTSHLVSRGFVGSRIIPLEDCTILSRDTTIAEALHVVVREHLVFLAGTDGITEFTVVSDLDRHAVRCYLYVLICELEMRLADRIDAQLGDAGVMPQLGRRGKQEYDKARARGAETRAVEYLYFGQYQQLGPTNDDVIDAFPGAEDELPGALRELNTLRNVVAHPSASVLARFEPEEVSRLASQTDQFVVRLREQARTQW